MSNDVRSAAERVRRHRAAMATHHHQQSPYFAPEAHDGYLHQLDEDRERLAYAYLSEHPADDELPITEEWLRSVGFCDAENDYWIWLQATDLFIARSSENKWTIEGYGNGETVSISAPKTRGQLRRLAACLGIELQEQPNA